jgi:hypothetical protein
VPADPLSSAGVMEIFTSVQDVVGSQLASASSGELVTVPETVALVPDERVDVKGRASYKRSSSPSFATLVALRDDRRSKKAISARGSHSLVIVQGRR